MFPNSSSSIELSRSALENNLDFLRKLVGPDVTISSVLKGNAYGHGIKHMVPELERLGIRHFSVFGSFEALDVASFSTESSTILIMGDILDDHMPWMIENDVECFVFNKIRLNALCTQARLMKKKARIHLELETGMNRTGINPKEWKEMAALLEDYSD
ncbi:MAG: alanine racemase [Imperialibacter sp.]|uniref:alanine racemase n=1 Tax=Imperialibacter sp. TaxID=2038411 RepID=UPI0032EF2FDC